MTDVNMLKLYTSDLLCDFLINDASDKHKHNLNK